MTGLMPKIMSHIEPISENVTVIPKHIAVIMDGNGRWAQSKGRCALQVTEKVRKPCVKPWIRRDNGVRYLTLYAFRRELETFP